MKIIEQTATRLVLRDLALAVVLWSIGGLFALIGVWTLLSVGSTVTQNGRTSELLVGSVFCLAGLLAMSIGRLNTWIFDRSLGKLTLNTVSLWKVQTRIYPLDQFVGTRVEESESTDGDSTYRVVLTRLLEECVPLSYIYTTGIEPKRQLAEQLNRFLAAR